MLTVFYKFSSLLIGFSKAQIRGASNLELLYFHVRPRGIYEAVFGHIFNDIFSASFIARLPTSSCHSREGFAK